MKDSIPISTQLHAAQNTKDCFVFEITPMKKEAALGALRQFVKAGWHGLEMNCIYSV